MYKCSSCGSIQSKWSGKCNSCDSWNTLSEVETDKKLEKKSKWKSKETFKILDSNLQIDRVLLKSSELNNVLGWWIVPWSLILLSGEPGIGKSTLSLQIADWYATTNNKVLYVSSEENVSQLSWRAARLSIKNQNIEILNNSCLEDIEQTIENTDSNLIIIDSISVIYSLDIQSSSWSISQIKYIAEQLLYLAKKSSKSIIIIGHVTKDWTISWPKLLEHLVDSVLYLEWSKYENYRILRSLKNRFWPTDEVGLFKMTNNWLQDITNPWLEFINEQSSTLSWSSISVTMEWVRPLIIEIEALTTYTKFGYPKRSSRWINSWKLDLLLAVINKFCDTKLDSYDVYVNIARWLSITEPWIDLAIIAAIISSKKSKPLWKTVYIWEVSLTWVIKSVFEIEKRISEAIKLWFEKIVIPSWVADSKKLKNLPWIVEIKNIKELDKII